MNSTAMMDFAFLLIPVVMAEQTASLVEKMKKAATLSS
jgi:hypothetical protein